MKLPAKARDGFSGEEGLGESLPRKRAGFDIFEADVHAQPELGLRMPPPPPTVVRTLLNTRDSPSICGSTVSIIFSIEAMLAPSGAVMRASNSASSTSVGM